MKEPFCDNPKCINYILVEPGTQTLYKEVTIGSKIEYARHKYANPKTRQFFFLCDICHDARTKEFYR